MPKLHPKRKALLVAIALIGTLSGCASRKYVRLQAQTLEPAVQEAQNGVKENAERIDAVDRRAQAGATAAQAADQKATQAQAAAQNAGTAAEAADRKADTANQGVQQINNRITTLENRTANLAGATLGPRIPGVTLLTQNQNEQAGYGLYSYLLFPPHPHDALTEERYTAVIMAYVTEFPKLIDQLRSRPDKRRIHILYVPIKGNVHSLEPERKDDAALNKLINDLLTDADEARSDRILKELRCSTNVKVDPLHCARTNLGGPGPYIATALVPIGKVQAGDPILLQDFSGLTPPAITLQMAYFNDRTTRPDFRDRDWMAETRVLLVNSLSSITKSLGVQMPLITNVVSYITKASPGK